MRSGFVSQKIPDGGSGKWTKLASIRRTETRFMLGRGVAQNGPLEAGDVEAVATFEKDSAVRDHGADG